MVRRADWKIIRWIPISIVALAIPSGEAMAQCADERFEPPGAVVHGRTVAEWTAAYFQWFTAIPVEGGNPLYDPAGAFCNKEQDEAVFFLPDILFVIILGEDPLPHAGCEVPCGRPILVPITWALMWAPGDCEPENMDDCAALADRFVDSVTIVEVTLDDVPLPCPADHREVSPIFEFHLPPPAPDNNVFFLDEPLTRKAVSDGYWMLLKPLAPGKHTMGIRTAVDGEEFPRLYEITVAPCGGATFRRSDADGNEVVNLSDAVATLDRLFRGAPALPCDDAADSDDSGNLDLTDAVHTLNHLFLGGPAPPAPGPDDCGVDPTADDGLSCGRGC
jgi:hypothetical protein